MLNKQRWLILFLFICFISFSQKFTFKEMPLVFLDSKTNEIIAIDKEETIIKLYKNKKIPLKTNGYLGKLTDYKSFAIKGNTYLVHNGCGPVLEFRNDSLVRLDNSFLHSNQYDAATFTYDNEIYFFGGYGLFSTKKFITKFDFNSKEWRIVKTKNHHLITPSAFNYFFKGKEYLYVFGGMYHTIDDKKIENTEFIYRLHLKTMTWERFKTDFFKHDKSRKVSTENGTHFFEFNGELVVLDNAKIFVINFDKNTYKEYESDLVINSKSFIPYRKKVVALFEDFSPYTKSNFAVEQFSVQNILKKPLREERFYYEEKPYYLYVLGLVIILSFGFFVYKKRRFISYYLNPSFPFQYWILSQALYYKGNKVNHLSEDDVKILNKIALQPNQFISLNEFNEMFTIDYETENYAAIVKRREKKLDNFLKLLANVSGLDISYLIQERKNETDKRIKEILFLDNKIKFIQK